MRIIVKKALYYFILFNSLLLSEILPQDITVTSPNGGENWHAGTNEHFITWTSDNITGRLSIDLIGGNLVTNGIDWNDSNGDGLADGWATLNGAPSIVE